MRGLLFQYSNPNVTTKCVLFLTCEDRDESALGSVVLLNEASLYEILKWLL